MKLYSIYILYKDVKVKEFKSAHDLSSFGYFQRSSVKEFMNFTSRIIVERSPLCSRTSVKEQENMCHVYVKSDSLAAVVFSDYEYPNRVAHTLLNKVLDEFAVKYPASKWSVLKESDVDLPQLEELLKQYQDPKQSDAMTKIQSDLDETKIILHNTIEAVLDRGEKLDDLIEKSEGLSLQSKTFYKTAKKTNQCCTIL